MEGAVPEAVAEIDGQADDEPDEEPEPGGEGQAGHETRAEDDADPRQEGA